MHRLTVFLAFVYKMFMGCAASTSRDYLCGNWYFSSEENKCVSFIGITQGSMTWNAGLEHCHKQNSHLVDVKSEIFANKFRNQSKQANVWIGATDKKHEGFFVWSDDTLMTIADFNLWTQTKPNNSQGKDCILINSSKKMQVVSCGITAKVVCQKKNADVCQDDNGNCDQTCTPGTNHTRSCTCKEGYFLRGGTNCIATNPCAINKGGCEYTCTNPSPGRKRCHCKEGYIEGIGQNCVKDLRGLTLLNQLIIGVLLIILIMIMCAVGAQMDLKDALYDYMCKIKGDNSIYQEEKSVSESSLDSQLDTEALSKILGTTTKHWTNDVEYEEEEKITFEISSIKKQFGFKDNDIESYKSISIA